MKNVIPFSRARPSACVIRGGRPNGRRERPRIEDFPLKEPVCDDCLLAFWEDLMATEPSQRERRAGLDRLGGVFGRLPTQLALCCSASYARLVAPLLVAMGHGFARGSGLVLIGSSAMAQHNPPTIDEKPTDANSAPVQHRRGGGRSSAIARGPEPHFARHLDPVTLRSRRARAGRVKSAIIPRT